MRLASRLLCISAIAAAAISGWNGTAVAACSTTIGVLDKDGIAKTYCVGTDGASGLFSQVELIDSSGTAYTNTSHALDVNIKSGNPTSITANAGTNLNTSLLALESGGNLATLAGTVSASKVAISAASLPLPSGAATLAKQPALGTAGSAASDVITVQGISSMTKLLVTPDANSSVNLSQVGGSSTATGHGTASGALRVELPTDGTGLVTANPGTAANWAVGATASPPPANGHYNGVSSSGNLTGVVGCDNHVFKHITSAADTLAVQGVSSKAVKICGVLASFSGSAAQAIFLENTASTNANCGSTNTQIAGLLTGNSSSPLPTGFYSPFWGGLANTSGNGLCINTAGTGGVDVDIWYTQGS